MRILRLALALVVVLGCVRAASAQTVRHGSLRPEDRARIAAEGGAAARAWIVDARAESGAVTRILGKIDLKGANPQDKFRDFATRFGPLFDAPTAGLGAIELAPPRSSFSHKNGSPRILRATQVVNGFELPGFGLTVQFDEAGNAVLAHGLGSPAAAKLPPPALSEAAALAIGEDYFRWIGYESQHWQSAPKVKAKKVELAPAPHLLYRVGGVLRDRFAPLTVDVDAATGAILRAFEDKEIFAGSGEFHQTAQIFPFNTGTGKAVAYKSLANAALDLPTSTPLKELGFETAFVNLAENGSLFGRFCWVLSALNGIPDQFHTFGATTGHTFLGNPHGTIPEMDLFDGSNAYVHLTNFALNFVKMAGGIPTDFSMPTVVNVPGLVNAFFSGTDLGVSTGPGFMAFGDLTGMTGVDGDDFARDPSVMCHEYTHGIAAFAGLTFGAAPLDHPPRAVNEALADYFAASFLKDPRIGFALAQLCGTQLFMDLGLAADGLRNLAAPKTMVDNLTDLLDGAGIPEEHFAGHIFGATLWRIRTILKQKKSDGLLLFSVLIWPLTMAEVGFPVVNGANAVDAYAAYYQACLETLIDDSFLIGNKPLAMKVLGAAMTNGAIGCPELNTGYVLDGLNGGTFTINSAFLGTSEGHLVGLDLQAGQTFSLIVAGNAKDLTLVDFNFFGPLNGLTLVQPVKTSANGLTLTAPKILVNTSATYTLEIFTLAANGRYKLTLKVAPP